MFDITELRVFVGILAGKTLTQIGDQLTLSHPSVSKALRAAELKAGVKLTERHGRRLRLTADGTRFASAAQDVLARLGELDGMLARVRSGEGGSLRILASNRVCSYVLPPVVGHLLAEIDDIDLVIEGVDAEANNWHMFDSGNFDVVISRVLPPAHVTASHLFDDELCLCVAADSDLAHQDRIHWPDLSDRTLIGPPADNELWRQFSLLGIRPRRRVQVSNPGIATRLVEGGQAVALMYRSMALEEARRGRIAILPLPDAPITVSYWMATRGVRGAGHVLNRFVELLRAHARSGIGDAGSHAATPDYPCAVTQEDQANGGQTDS
jgi:DNA-binding transcriptional LysR family regulator